MGRRERGAEEGERKKEERKWRSERVNEEGGSIEDLKS